MPLYNQSAFATLPEIAIPGKPAYFYGSLPTDTSDTLIRISKVALASNVATVTGTIYSGNIPAVGNTISIQGTATSSGLFNVARAVLTAVSVTASTGEGTFSFALTGSNVTATNDAGMAIVPIAESSEACANGSSVAIYVPSNELRDLGEKSITVATTFPSLPTAATVTLQTAINNVDAEFTDMGTVATVASGAQSTGVVITFTTPAGRFFRLITSGVSGGANPSIISKMVC